MIRRVLIENWRCHAKSVFSFEAGTNGLIGLMGAGKTSVLDAVSFAFFGTFPALQTRKLSLDDIIMARPVKKDKARVKLDFEIDGKIYQVERVISRGKGTKAELRSEGTLLESGTKRVTAEIEHILKMDYDLFSRAVYAEQNALDYFLTIPRGQRMRKLDELLRIDRFELAKSSTTTLINRLGELAKTKRKMLDETGAREEIEKIPAIENEIKRINKEKEGTLKKLAEIGKDVEKTRKVLQELELGKEELEQIRQKKAKCEGIIHELCRDVQKLSSEVHGLKEQDVRKRIEKGEGKIKKLGEEREKLKKELRRAIEMKQEAIVRIKNLREQVEKIRAVIGRCPICDRPLTKEHRQKLLHEREEKIAEFQARFSNAEKNERNVDAKLLENSKEKERGEQKVKELSETLKKILELKEKEKLLHEHRTELQKVASDLYRLEKKFAVNKIKQKQEDLQKLVAHESELRERVSASEKFLLEWQEKLKSLLERKKMLMKYEEEIERAEFVREEMLKFRHALIETQLTLRQHFITAVNSMMAAVWSDLYPYGDYSSIRLAVEHGDYMLQLLEPGGSWISVEGVASGGERTIACLALRIAFARVLAPNLRWLVLDEPTHNLDARAVQDLANVLRSRMTEFVDQVFLITHDPRLEDGITGYLYRLERDKGKSEPTRVVCIQSLGD